MSAPVPDVHLHRCTFTDANPDISVSARDSLKLHRFTTMNVIWGVHTELATVYLLQ